jgi:hypothetical protein
VVLPEQSTVAQVQDALDKLNALPPETGHSAAQQHVPSEVQSAAKDTAEKKQRTAVKILSFEGEVDPFQFTVLSTGPLGFFRKAWRNDLRYIQGFVVDKDELLQRLISPEWYFIRAVSVAYCVLPGAGDLLPFSGRDERFLVARPASAVQRYPRGAT